MSIIQKQIDDAVTAAVKADRERRLQIACSPEATGRRKLATHLACATDVTVEQARAALRMAPVDPSNEERDWSAFFAADDGKSGDPGAAH
jgi:hypothetical protein